MKVIEVKGYWTLFKGAVRRRFAFCANDCLDADRLKAIARGIATARPDEIDCGTCFEQMDRFVEMTLAGKNAAEALPLVQDHIEHCRDCREEFEALLLALHAVGLTLGLTEPESKRVSATNGTNCYEEQDLAAVNAEA